MRATDEPRGTPPRAANRPPPTRRPARRPGAAAARPRGKPPAAAPGDRPIRPGAAAARLARQTPPAARPRPAHQAGSRRRAPRAATSVTPCPRRAPRPFRDAACAPQAGPSNIRSASTRVSCALRPLETLSDCAAAQGLGHRREARALWALATEGGKATRRWGAKRAVGAASALREDWRPGVCPKPRQARREACALWALGPKAQSDPKCAGGKRQPGGLLPPKAAKRPAGVSKYKGCARPARRTPIFARAAKP